ncbi:ribose 5-phosphate isomerase B [Roseomonas sp. NAR14]|uniref:Ribose 5-phosphate isomerase B n=1 Tax=Roseomonas acroporae TaxID=2937791 RepID=A0A9X2BVC1_9PROT|nr:ribose 5-phosphate isomerase B [Roseomonas acroporae]MCK8783854.1 ribose 5-phosphate isomerase B [Roseomonas acroporae]
MTEERLTIAMGADHGGFILKDTLRRALEAAGHKVLDFGTSGPESVDYPDFAHPVCDAVARGEAGYGVLVCGSGIGMQIAANRHLGIRCAVLHDTTEARLTRAHNDANVAAFGARLTGPELALDALSVFLDTPYEGGRHDNRLAKLAPLSKPMALGPIDLPEPKTFEERPNDE